MAVYEAHTWETGETIDADLLNHMEDGIAEAGDAADDARESVRNGCIQDGETVTLTTGFYHGDITDGKKTINIAIPMAKSMRNVSSVVCATLKANICNAGGYCLTTAHVGGGSQYANLVNSIEVEKNTNTLFINIVRSTAFTANNNDGLQCRIIEAVFTFSTN